VRVSGCGMWVVTLLNREVVAHSTWQLAGSLAADRSL
jgi:hypothetical protein